MTEYEISKVVLDASLEVHRTLGGPGLLESVYEESLAFELGPRGLKVRRQIEVPIRYKGNILATPLKLDLLLNNLVIVEVKAVTIYHKIFEVQILTYLRLMDLKLGSVINFRDTRVGNGTHRVVNGLKDTTVSFKKPLRLCGFATLR